MIRTFNALVLLQLFLFASALEAAPKDFGKIVGIEGKVKVLRKLKKLDIKIGTLLREKDRVSTGADGSLEIEIGKGNNMRVGPKSKLTLRKEGKNSLDFKVELEGGSIRNKLDNFKKKKFVLKTPTAVAGVRGTDFVTSYNPAAKGAQSFNLAVLSGSVSVQSIDSATKEARSVMVGQSQKVSVSAGGQMSNVVKMNASEVSAIRKAHPIKHQVKVSKDSGGEKKDSKKKDKKKSKDKKDDKKKSGQSGDKKGDKKSGGDKSDEGKKSDDKGPDEKAGGDESAASEEGADTGDVGQDLGDIAAEIPTDLQDEIQEQSDQLIQDIVDQNIQEDIDNVQTEASFIKLKLLIKLGKLIMKPNVILPVIVFLFAVACGGGGGDKQRLDSGLDGKIKVRFKANESQPIQAGTEIYILYLANKQELLGSTPLTPGQESIDVEFEEGKSYLVVLTLNGMSYLRSIILASQIEAAKDSGTLDIGEINAVTTYITGQVELDLFGKRQQATADPEAAALSAVQNKLAEYFQGVGDMSSLALNQVESLTPNPSGAWNQAKNRINLLMVYFEMARSTPSPTGTQTQAMNELFTALFDTTNSADLQTKLSSPNLPQSSDGGASQLANLESRGILLTGTGVLASKNLQSLYFDPSNNIQLINVALQTPSASIAGKITGRTSESIAVELTSANGNPLEKATTDKDGNFSISGLLPGDYTLKAAKTGYVFNPPEHKFKLDASLQKAGFDFQSFLFVQGSQKVPLPAQVQAGIIYTSADGKTDLTGTARFLGPAAYISVSTSASFVVKVE